MRVYSYSSSRRRRGRSGTWVYFISVSLIILAMKIAFPSHDVACSLGDEEEFGMSSAGIEAENSVIASGTNSIRQPKLQDVRAATLESNGESDALIDDAMTRIKAKSRGIIEARDKLNEMLSMPMSAQQLAFAKEQLSSLSEKWLFSGTVFPEDKLCGSYKVKPGDQFGILSNRFKVPYEILMQINNISNAKALRADAMIKIIKGPFHCKIDRSTFTMDLYLQDTFVRSFPVSFGKFGMETAPGRWVVKRGGKLKSPSWTDPTDGKTYNPEDSDYPLGSKWIGLERIEGAGRDGGSFGIHGTKKVGETGKAGSAGCIGLCEDDATLVYNLLAGGISQVTVVE